MVINSCELIDNTKADLCGRKEFGQRKDGQRHFLPLPGARARPGSRKLYQYFII
jgi:hypothetical protein